MTWLYYMGDAAPPSLDWSTPEPEAQCGHNGSRENRRVLSKREASATPSAFAELLIQMAKDSTAKNP
jgi:hypothetical protein